MKVVFLAFLLAQALGLSAQQYLYIKKGNEFPEKRYGLRSSVHFKTDSLMPWSSGIISDIGPDYIDINGVKYAYRDIIAFRSRNELLSIGGTALWAGGALFTGIALVNGIINGDRPLIKQSQLIWGGGLILGGLAVYWMGKKEYHRADGWRWVVIDLNQTGE